MASVFAKLGTRFDVIAPSGFRILWALGQLVSFPGAMDIVITSGTDGAHSGPDDPHHFGAAYDLRSHDFPGPDSKQAFIKQLIGLLGDGTAPISDSGGWAGGKFWAWLENPDTPDEHFHIQLRKGMTYP